MYTRGMLIGFADQIDDPEDESNFRRLISKVPFFRSGGGTAEKCEHGSIEQLGVSLGITHLTTEFFQRFVEFISACDFTFTKRPMTMEEYIASITPEISDEELESN